uniref:Uncharacterized protein n=1 Tax=Naja naja TaxID=35670 RepID=A0A8C6Y081_NAJNA
QNREDIMTVSIILLNCSKPTDVDAMVSRSRQSLLPKRHFMGKKSTGDFPYIYEDRQEMPFSLMPDNAKQLGSYLQQDESFKELLKRVEEDEDQNSQVLREEPPFSSKNVWGTEESSRFKDVSEVSITPICSLHSSYLTLDVLLERGKVETVFS